jgi:two-component system, NtrC family, sensor kinase
MLPKNIRLKVSLYLIIALSAAMALFIVLIVKHQQEDLQGEISRHVMQISEVIVKSTRYAMLLNERDIAAKIIQDIGKQKGIERVRVISKAGTIVHSNHPAEVGHSIDQQAEPCVRCHQTSKPLEQVPDDLRWRIYETSEGQRVLGTMKAIRNELSCSSASCHEHPASQSVLGVVDIAYSLDEIDQAMKMHTLYIVGISLGFILLVSLSVGVLLQRLIYLPLKDLESGAKKVTLGDLDHDIPVRNDDEFGHVAGSFNQMTLALKKSMSEMQELVQTLELKVEKRTQELRVAEAEVAQGEKLASVGLLASGVAHELNNPLTGVLTFTSLLRKKMEDGSPDAEDLDLVIRETKRCASIIRRLLDFAREKIPVKGFFDLNQLIEDTLRFIDRPASLQRSEEHTSELQSR